MLARLPRAGYVAKAVLTIDISVFLTVMSVIGLIKVWALRDSRPEMAMITSRNLCRRAERLEAQMMPRRPAPSSSSSTPIRQLRRPHVPSPQFQIALSAEMRIVSFPGLVLVFRLIPRVAHHAVVIRLVVVGQKVFVALGVLVMSKPETMRQFMSVDEVL